MAEVKSNEFKTIWLAGSTDNNTGFRDGAAGEVLIQSVRASCLDNDGNVVLADSENHAVRLFDTKTHAVRTLAGTGKQGLVDDCKAEFAQFSLPKGVAVDD